MPQWYPTQERATALVAELEKLKAATAELADGPEFLLRRVSRALVSAPNVRGFPLPQVSRWIWLASQFRILAISNEAAASEIRAALNYLLRYLSQTSLSEGDIQDLNWVLDSTVRKSRSNLRSNGRRSNLSAQELGAIETQLAQLVNVTFDAEKVRSGIQNQLDDLKHIAGDPHLASVHEKIERLFEASTFVGDEGCAAREALLYLAEADDVVADSLGIFGLVDDCYVIDWAFALVTKQTRCLPILEAFLEEWPFIADLALLGNPPSQLDLYTQYLACACLNRLFEHSGTSLLVLRETAGFSTICALMAALQCVRLQADARERELENWPLGQSVVIGDGTKQFNATFAGLGSMGDKRKIWLGVGNSGTISIDASLTPYIARRATKEKKLSNGRQILSWLKSRHLDPLVGLLGGARRGLETQECILLVCPRHKIDTYFVAMRPFGTTTAALVGAKYVSSDLALEEIDGYATDAPFIYACSNPEVAAELLGKPPHRVSGWKVIVDGAGLGWSLNTALKNSDGLQNVPMCILGELHEKETAAELTQTGIQCWYIESEDVQVPPSDIRTPNETTDALARSARRQGLHSIQKRRVESVSSEFLEQLAECLRERVNSEGGGPQVKLLDMAASSFLQKAISTPLWDQASALDISTGARRIASHASTLAQYDQKATKYLKLFNSFDDRTAIQFDRIAELKSLVATGSGSIAVVCRSLRVVDICRKISRGTSGLGHVEWTTIAGLKVEASFDRVIVPGWLDGESMRDIALNGYGRDVMFLLFPFEERWFKSTMDASQRWERNLRVKTTELLRNLPVVQTLARNDERLWRRQLEERVRETDEPIVSTSFSAKDLPEVEQLESRAIAWLKQQFGSFRTSQATAKARLVLFEDDGAYSFLHPEGKVIVLPEGSAAKIDHQFTGSNAEALLFRSVNTLRPGMILAFPKGSDRDLIDARADQFIHNAKAIRAAADLWKRSLKERLKNDWSSYGEFSRKMAAAGHVRSSYTVRSWATNTNSIAPRNYREVIPLIARLTDDVELARRTDDVLTSIDLVYRARSKAAEAIVRELFSGQIDPLARELSFEIDGSSVQYTLHRIRRTVGVQEVPVDLIGKVQTLDAHIAAGHGSVQELPLQ